MIWMQFEIKICFFFSQTSQRLINNSENTWICWMVWIMSMLLVMWYAVLCLLLLFFAWHRSVWCSITFDANGMFCHWTFNYHWIRNSKSSSSSTFVWATLSAFNSIVLQRLSAPAIQTIVVISIHAVSLYTDAWVRTCSFHVNSLSFFFCFFFCSMSFSASLFVSSFTRYMYFCLDRCNLSSTVVSSLLQHLHYNNSISSVHFKNVLSYIVILSMYQLSMFMYKTSDFEFWFSLPVITILYDFFGSGIGLVFGSVQSLAHLL